MRSELGVPVANLRSGYLENGGSRNLFVNGSVTPVLFTLDIPDNQGDMAITTLDIAFNSAAPLQSGNSFLSGTGLTNGIEYGFINTDGVEIPVDRGTIKNNIDIFSRDAQAQVQSMVGNDVVLTAQLQGTRIIIISATSFTQIFMKIQDDLSIYPWGEAYVRMSRV